MPTAFTWQLSASLASKGSGGSACFKANQASSSSPTHMANAELKSASLGIPALEPMPDKRF
eukprot:scaffold278_cov20-Tisochrysis_lutea.AAC.1